MPDPNQQLTRLRPWDLYQAKERFGDLKASELIEAMQTEQNLSHDCPKCVPDTIEMNPEPTGLITVTLADQTTTQGVCDICEGYLKTAQEYVEDPDNPGQYFPYVEQPAVDPELIEGE